jgi:ribosomal protein S18 acetylase RimI-like enzyme
MKIISKEIVLSPHDADHEDIWRTVFYDAVQSHFETLRLPKAELNDLLEFQFQAQSLDYAKNYPLASNYVILSNSEPAGRLIISTEHNDLHLIDIAILTDFRNRGIGTKILEWLFEQSRQTKLPIRFYVEKINPAMRLYERLGFRVVADVTSHFQMQWSDPGKA